MAFPPSKSDAMSAPSTPSTPPMPAEPEGDESTATCPACGAKVKLVMAEPTPDTGAMPEMPGA